MPVAKVEGPHSFYPPKSRITHQLLDTFVKHYDPAFRIARVVCGYDPITGSNGPAHEAGKYLPSPGKVAAFRKVGDQLHALIQQNETAAGKPAVRELVKMGFDGVSIKWMPTSDLPGAPPYPEHVALLSGEVPGTPGIPPLSAAFRALEEWGLAEDLPFVPAAAPELGPDGVLSSNYFTRSLAECERSWIDPATPEDGQPAKEDSTMALTPEETSALITRAVTEAVAAIRPEITAAVEAGVAPIRTIAEAATTAATEAATTARTLAETTSIASHEGRVRACVQAGRLIPGHLDESLETLRALPAGEGREKFVARLEARKSLRSVTNGIPYLEGAEMASPDLAQFADPDGNVRVRPEDADLHSRTLAEIKGDMSKYAEVALRLSREGSN